MSVYHWPGELNVCGPFAQTSILVLITTPTAGEVNTSEKETGYKALCNSTLRSVDFSSFIWYPKCATLPYLSYLCFWLYEKTNLRLASISILVVWPLG